MRMRMDGTERPEYPDDGWDEYEGEIAIEITYGPSPCDPDESDPLRVCHVPQPGESDDVRWIGFDFGHAGDYSPGSMFRSSKDVYRDLPLVKEYCARFAAQVKEVQRKFG
jgi:hypothetical protein